MYLTVKQRLKHLTTEEYASLRFLCRIAKNLANQGIYNVRQHYFQERKYLNYEKNYVLLKESENYRILNSNMAQQILKSVDGSFSPLTVPSRLFLSSVNLRLRVSTRYGRPACRIIFPGMASIRLLSA